MALFLVLVSDTTRIVGPRLLAADKGSVYSSKSSLYPLRVFIHEQTKTTGPRSKAKEVGN